MILSYLYVENDSKSEVKSERNKIFFQKLCYFKWFEVTNKLIKLRQNFVRAKLILSAIFAQKFFN